MPARGTTKRKQTPRKRAAKKPERRAMLARLWELGRSMSTQTVFLHQAIAQSVGLGQPTPNALI